MFDHIKNSGQTPAYNLIHWAQAAVCTPEEQDEVLTIPPLDDAVPNTLAPGGFNSKWIFRTERITPDEIADVIARRKMLYLYGRVEYNDMVGLNITTFLADADLQITASPSAEFGLHIIALA